ncbi:serine/threonine-protein kinase [Actinophytocola oryzae]|uniref:non-specific serine/threonine protein kinase n=1 Tax=Actinophytocola oryzae TaxID=502181 RepID=A0A4R7VBD6_9PSEU|nr:serine/threonine-protein kinase [Actinophytocola oryzae]TDV46364.1 serine/threonine protein kinase [Actinophytocola oryzae]
MTVSVPGYQIADVLGRGGFGVVYRARHLTIDREVAIKVDTRVILDDRDQRRFLREVRAAGRLSGHPHVVEIYDAGVLPDSRPYIVMELCSGGSLADRGPMAPRDVAEIGQRIADALAAAHDLGVLHRDIKPGNILVKRYGTVALSDFGLAALMETGRDTSVTLEALTPAYAAPEQFHLVPPTPRSDVYALAATLYTLLSGHPPRYPADRELSLPEIIRLHDTPLDDLPGVPPQFMAVLRRGLARDPAHRYQDAAALRADLSQLNVGDLPSPRHAVTSPVMTAATPRYPPPTPPGGMPPQYPVAQHPTPPPSRRAGRVGIWVGAALAAVLVVTGVWYFALRDTGGGGHGAADTINPTTTSPTKTPTETYGVRTVTEGCPAAGIKDAQAACVEKAECWSGMVVINGEIESIRRLPCDQGHVYETYAIALVPGDVADPYADVLEAHPVVQKVCSMDTLLASRYGDALQYGPERWKPEVLPPSSDDRSTELGVYRCVATITEIGTIQGSAFRPR